MGEGGRFHEYETLQENLPFTDCPGQDTRRCPLLNHGPDRYPDPDTDWYPDSSEEQVRKDYCRDLQKCRRKQGFWAMLRKLTTGSQYFTQGMGFAAVALLGLENGERRTHCVELLRRLFQTTAVGDTNLFLETVTPFYIAAMPEGDDEPRELDLTKFVIAQFATTFDPNDRSEEYCCPKPTTLTIGMWLAFTHLVLIHGLRIEIALHHAFERAIEYCRKLLERRHGYAHVWTYRMCIDVRRCQSAAQWRDKERAAFEFCIKAPMATSAGSSPQMMRRPSSRHL